MFFKVIDIGVVLQVDFQNVLNISWSFGGLFLVLVQIGGFVI